jgi:hypothetical protein
LTTTRITCLEESGTCSAQKYFRQCIDNGGRWDNRQLSDVTECNSGCCQIIDESNILSQYQVTFGIQCEKDAEKLGIGYNFVPGACEVLEKQTGCCFSRFGCDMSTELECNGLEWFGGQECSELSNVCGNCGDYELRRCYQGDVHLFNKCGEPSPEPVKYCDANTQMCDPNQGNAQCKDISCNIPINFTTLSYDTAYFKSGDVGVQYGKKVGKVNVKDNYVIHLENGESACVQYQGPGETHEVYTCDRGEVKGGGISVFGGRTKICEYVNGKVKIRDNEYQSCLDCSSVEQEEGPGYKLVKFLSKLGELAGWQAIQYQSWDYWLINPGMCNKRSSCDSKGDCIYAEDGSNWCTPKYPVDTFETCNAFTTSRSGSPWSTAASSGTACQSSGSCRLDDKGHLSYLGTTAVCLGDTIAGATADWLIGEAAGIVLGDGDSDKKIGPPTEEDTSGIEGDKDFVGPPTPPKEGDDPKSGWQKAWSRVQGVPESFKENIVGKILFPILKLGGIINLDALEAAARHYFLGVVYPELNEEEEEFVGPPALTGEYDSSGETTSEGTITTSSDYSISGLSNSDSVYIQNNADSSKDGKVTVQELINFMYSESDNTYSGAKGVAKDYGIDFDKLVEFKKDEGGRDYTVKFTTQQSPVKLFNQKSNRILFSPIRFGPDDSSRYDLNSEEPYNFYGQEYFVEYTQKETNEYKIAKEWMKAWWEGVGGFWGIIWSRLKTAGVNVGIATLLDSTIGKLIKKTIGDEFFSITGWLNPQKWFRAAACRMATFNIPGISELCENKYFFNFVSCAVVTAVQQDSYSANVCIPKDHRKVGFSDCYLCNDDPNRPCTPERCYNLGTNCDYDGNRCDANEEALKACGSTVNRDLKIETDLEGLEVEYTDTYFELDVETTKSAECKYTTDPEQNYDDMTKFNEHDRAGLHHSVSLWTGDPLINSFKYYLRCRWSCDEKEWGEQLSPIYEIDIRKLPKGDQEPPVIVESYPYTAQLLESANTVNMWVKGDEPLSGCKYGALDFDDFIDEAEDIIGSTISGGDSSDEQASTVVDNLLMGFELLNPSEDMVRKSDDTFEIQLDVESGTDYAYSIVCEDLSGHTSRPKIMLFRISNPFDITIIKPENGLTTSEHIKDLSVSTGAKDTECKYSLEDKERYAGMNYFATTSERIHVTELSEPLKSGEHLLYVSCVDFDSLDLASAESYFTITPDTTAPQLIRILGGNELFIRTDEESNCTYSDEGFDNEQAPMTNSGEGSEGFFMEHTLHVTDSSVYYIKCLDREGNLGKYTIYP